MKLNRNLSHYSKLYKNFLDEETCKETIEQIKNINFEQHQFYDSLTSYYSSYKWVHHIFS